MCDRLYVYAEDLWAWLDDNLEEIDEDFLWLLDDWGLDDGDAVPGQLLLALVTSDGRLTGTLMSWGVPPPWLPNDSPLLIVSSETALAEQPWDEWLGRQRCIVPVSAYYSRQQPGAQVRLASGEAMPLAALYGTDANGLVACAILTVAAGDDLSPRHQRQPLIVPSAQVGRWLDPAIKEPGPLRDLLVPLEPGSLKAEELMRVVPDSGPDAVQP